MRKIKTACAALSAVVISTSAAVTPAYADDSCPAGYSCYYDGISLDGKIWTAPSCGWFDLGRFSPPLNDRIGSIWNGGGGGIQPYNWTGSAWQPIGNLLPPGQWYTYQGSYNNIVDAINIIC